MSTAFVNRHIGPTTADRRAMLKSLGLPSLETLISQTLPASIRLSRPLDIEEGVSEEQALAELHRKITAAKTATSMIGQGYHHCHVPPVIQRNLLENPGWYTSYTPYQAEISQGRLEMLFHFQTLVSELTGLPAANASLLDEGTAIAEAASMAIRHHRSKRNKLALGNTLHPQSLDVLKTRCEMTDIELTEGEVDESCAAIFIQWPDTYGEIIDPARIVEQAKSAGALVIVASDPMALVMLDAPGNWGADIVVGSIQRFGVPMGNGGPHAAYMATTRKLTRLMPGRLIGQSIDAEGNEGWRLALQTREQHIRREKATSNICTAQALLANMNASYAIWHGPEGLVEIASRINSLAAGFAQAMKKAGYQILNSSHFDTVTIRAQGKADELIATARQQAVLLRRIDADTLGVAFDETSNEETLAVLAKIFATDVATAVEPPLAATRRGADFLTQTVFHDHRSETAMMRFLRKMMDKDLALDRAMIPLGSCTMKLNAAAEMMPLSWPQVSNVHPFAPPEYLTGYEAMIDDIDRWLSEITGFAKISFQPNAGSQGEFAGLVAIRKFHQANGEANRNICIIPASSHGTNPASAQMAGMEVVVVKSDANGNVDIADLKEQSRQHADNLAALMITYPSTHGVFEEAIIDICKTIHDNGGQVYLDGANLNAMLGLARPADIGADVCHMNLHKTFAIPHGGGGPGVGPIGVASHLVPFLPGHVETGTDHAVSAAPHGSASILVISWMFIRMLGAEGLKASSEAAVLNANYLAHRLSECYPVLYKGASGRVAHECIVDTRGLKDKAGISVDDIAKRLIDYGFHAPTMSWPVAGTLMIEPTESEPLSEIDRLADAMNAIFGEAKKVENGEWPLEDNPLVNAPHTIYALIADDWNHPYSRQLAICPAGVDMTSKYWSPVARIDNVYGDRNLVCTCPPIEEYAKQAE
ncbi:MAG: aminomethyl-transferring glycine dehydrogenase [Hyphomicrobiales bacterium]|nr:aminomethyl-transferring glycine dehydrogenase [Hyphomicrobiales bacterium]